MNIALFSADGVKKDAGLDLPAVLFEAPINTGLMALALRRQQSNRRQSIAHVKTRGEVRGSTRKLFQQKGTGRARRGSVRSPLLKGGGKAFGPRNKSNFEKDMPKKMRRAALFSCLSLKAKEGAIIGLENYPEDMKTKKLHALFTKMKLPIGRRIVIVTRSGHRSLELSARNIPKVKAIRAAYLNPEDILTATNMVFLTDAVKEAERVFGRKEAKEANETKESKEKNQKKLTKRESQAKGKQVKKKSSASLASSESFAS